MPAWNELLQELAAQPTPQEKAEWLNGRHVASLKDVAKLRGDRNVLLYASGFLQRSEVPGAFLSIGAEDINALMSVLYGMKWKKGLTIILHTPGGGTNATETFVSYLWSKFPDIEVIVPTYAFSAGTMISLAANRIVMGRQSQLGPIDSQIGTASGVVSAQAVVDQFRRARREVRKDAALAPVWIPILTSLGPSLLQDCQNALAYGERMVARWLEGRMLSTATNPRASAKRTARYFNSAGLHKSHGRRIDRDEARAHEVIVEDLETSQDLQEAVLTAYHLTTITFEQTQATKVLLSSDGRSWVKNFVKARSAPTPAETP